VAGSWKRGNESSGSIKSGEFLVRIINIFEVSVVEMGLEPYEMCSVSGTTHIYNTCKNKAILLQAWTGPECSRRLRFPDFKTVGT
jgi:hypothetical protein